MTKRKTTKAPANPYEGSATIGSDVRVAAGGPSMIYINYFLGSPPLEKTAQHPAQEAIMGFFYISDDDHELEMPEPWERETLVLGEDQRDVSCWVTYRLDILWLKYRQAKEVKLADKTRHLFSTFTPKTEMYTNDGAYIGDKYAQTKRQLGSILLTTDGNPLLMEKPVVMTAHGLGAGFSIKNDPQELGEQWYQSEMGLGALDLLTTYTGNAIIEESKRLGQDIIFNVLGTWKVTLVPRTDGDGNPIFFTVGKSFPKDVNPFEMLITEAPADAYAHSNSDIRMLVANQYEGIWDEWGGQWDSNAAIKATRGGSSDDEPTPDRDSNLTGTHHRIIKEEDDIPF